MRRESALEVGACLAGGDGTPPRPRPARRGEGRMGRWLGRAVLASLYAAGSGLLELPGIWLATGYTPPHPIVTLCFVAAEGIVLMSLALLLSTRMSPMTGGVIALVLFFVAWIGGIALAIGQAFATDTILNSGLSSRPRIPTDGLRHGPNVSPRTDRPPTPAPRGVSTPRGRKILTPAAEGVANFPGAILEG